MSRIEDRLRDAFDAAAKTVQPEAVGGLRARTRPLTARRVAPLAAAAAVAVIVVAASVSVPLLLAGGHQPRSPSTGNGAESPTPSGPSAAVRLVPDVSSMSVYEATATLQAVGLRIVVVSGAASGVPQGAVIAQSPAAGTRIPAGGTVTLSINGTLSSSTTFGLAPERTRLVIVSADAVTIAIPQDWRPTPNLGSAVGFHGITGWLEVRSAAYPAGVRAACTRVATGTAGHIYGSRPEIEYRRIDGRPGCLIIPSHDAPTAFQEPGGAPLPAIAALVEYRSPLGNGANFLVISADPPHVLPIIGSVELHH